MDMTDGVATRKAEAAAGESDQDIVAAVHVRRGRELWTLGRRLGLSADEADDAVQEALTRLLRELARGNRINEPEAWAFRVVYRLAMDEHRVRRRLGLVADRLRQRTPDTGPEVNLRMAVWDEVGHLPERQRAVLYLRYRSDFSFGGLVAVGYDGSGAHAWTSTDGKTWVGATGAADLTGSQALGVADRSGELVAIGSQSGAPVIWVDGP